MLAILFAIIHLAVLPFAVDGSAFVAAAASDASPRVSTTASVEFNATSHTLDLCAAAVASADGGGDEDGPGDLIVVALGAKTSDVFARRVSGDGTPRSAWLPAAWPAVSGAADTSISLTSLPRGEGVLCILCDAGALRTSVLQHLPTEAGGLSWGAWRPVLGAPSSFDCTLRPAVVSDPRTGLHVFAVQASDRSIVHATVPSSVGAGVWSFHGLGARTTAPPAAAIDASGALQLLVRGVDATLFHRSGSSSSRGSGSVSSNNGGGASPDGAAWVWSRWLALDAKIRGAPRLLLAARRPQATLSLVGRSHLDSAAFRLHQTPTNDGGVSGGAPTRTWMPRQSLGGLLAAPPTAAEDAFGTVHVIGLGPDGTAWHRSFAPGGGSSSSTNTPGGGWGSLGGDGATAPLVAIRPGDGLLSVLAADVEGSLHLKPMVTEEDGTVGWGAWSVLGGPVRPFPC